MGEKRSLDRLFEPLRSLQVLLDSERWKGMIVGGVASSLLGVPRFTHDIDVVVEMEPADIEDFLTQAEQAGLVPRVSQVRTTAQQSKVLLLIHKASKIPVDISLGVLPFERDAIRRRKKIVVKNISIRIPSPEDLIIFKGVDHRRQDLLDIQGVLKAHPRVDRRRIRRWLKKFANVLRMPEIYDDVEKLL